MNEKDLQAQIHRFLGGQKNIRLFRNQVGTYKLQDGRVVSSGLAKGSADLIGWKTVEITPDMVGQKLAIFTSVEIKTPTGRVSPEQSNWLKQVSDGGGISLIARSIDEAKQIV
jgi:hypothetical protein